MLALGLWLLGGLAALVFAAVAGRLSWLTALASAVGFAGAAALAAAGWAVDPVWAGAVIAAAALAALFERLPALPAALLAGLAAGSWLLIPASLSPWVAALALVALLAVGATLVLTARHPRFVTPALRDEALLIVLVLATAVAVALPLAAGWTSASNLQAGLSPSASPAELWWPVPLLIVALLGGVIVSSWRRR